MEIKELLIVLREIGIIYSSTTISSLFFNQIYYNIRINKAFKKSKRVLKYKNLSIISEQSIENIKDYCKIEKITSNLMSIVPLAQVIWTIDNINRNPKIYKDFFEEKMEDVNKKELLVRREFLEELKTIKVPEDIRIKMLDENYLPTEEDYMRSKGVKRRLKIPRESSNPLDNEHGRLWD